MDSAAEHIFDLTFGRWRSQIMYAGIALGVFDALEPIAFTPLASLSKSLQCHPDTLSRLLRSLVSLTLVEENAVGEYRLTNAGSFLSDDHPETLKWMVSLEEGPEHYAIWKHLPNMVKSGVQNGFELEYGKHAFDFAAENSNYADVFSNAMSSFSTFQSKQTLEAFDHVKMDVDRTICDIAGGHGHLLCSFLDKHRSMRGILFDLPSVIENSLNQWSKEFDVVERFSAECGDMFKAVPKADDYMMKMILHDWSDEECVSILQTARASAEPASRMFIAEHVVPSDPSSHFSKLYDIHMMCWGSGRERTAEEYAGLLEQAGWQYRATHPSATGAMSVVEGVLH